MPTELATKYDPRDAQERWLKFWNERGFFHSDPDPSPPTPRRPVPEAGRGEKSQQPFTIVIPPPNVTGALHMGHALNNTLQDVLIRWRRMQGYNALWMPGTDHAGIATQAVVERLIYQQEKKTRHDLGREELVKRIWQWKDQYEARILGQLKQLGCSCDWRRTRFTLDEVCSRAVRQTFFDFFKKGLIFRGKRLVNWDTQLQTSVADDETFHETVKGNFWTFKYPVKEPLPPAPLSEAERGERKDLPSTPLSASERGGGGERFIRFSTTRPETMLGDTAVAVHPNDERYKHLIGKMVTIPLVNRDIPIIADGILVDPELGTGAVKVTPAHDPNDYQCGLRHKLPMINILNPDGTINENGGKYVGLDRIEARKRVTADMEALGLLEQVEERDIELAHSDRSKTPIEPYLSDQWFVRMGDSPLSPLGERGRGEGVQSPSPQKTPSPRTSPSPLPQGGEGDRKGLAQMAMDAVTSGKVKFFPERYAKTYLDWLGEKRDWCISRQLWWGHRIPVWWPHARWRMTPDQMRTWMRELEEKYPDQVCVRWMYSEEGEDSPKGHGRPLVCLAPGADKIAEHELHGFQQDPDVLDTWFSSALWPHSTLGWPEQTTELKYYYPTNVLVTARGIITLWVARMVMAGLFNCGEVPFSHVYIYPTILDAFGETMSKSKGNGVDPLDVIELYGTDALRFSLTQMATETQEVRMPVANV